MTSLTRTRQDVQILPAWVRPARCAARHPLHTRASPLSRRRGTISASPQPFVTSQALIFAVALSGATVVGIHVWAKPHPTPDEIRSASRGYERPGQWRDRTAPDFDLTLLDGTTFKLSDHIGKEVVILN